MYSIKDLDKEDRNWLHLTPESNGFQNHTWVDCLIVNGKMINVFSDDYGQCYLFQYLDDKGELQTQGCGTYVIDYKTEIEDFFTPITKRLNDRIINLRQDLRELQRDNAYLLDKLKELYPDTNFRREIEDDRTE